MESRVTKGTHEVLFKEGDVARSLYIVQRGTVICLKRSKDRLVPVFRAEAGDVVGENAILGGNPYGYSAITITNAELIEISSVNFTQILKKSPDWLVGLTATMVQRFEKTASLVAENRVFNEKILTEEEFPTSVENHFKKMLS